MADFQIDPETDPSGYLGFVRNPDGSVTRKSVNDPRTPISLYDDSPLLVKDIPVNQSKKTSVRVFLPKESIESFPGRKLPVLIYFHGGGFVICNVASPLFDDIYSTFTLEIPIMIVSIDYRNAPEHRLPAAYEDCLEALYFIKNSQDEWLTKYADLSNSILMGSSAGGNIAYFVGLRASTFADDLKPLNIKGVILKQTFLGGTKRTESELKAARDKIVPSLVLDLMWDLSLPVGVDRDHEFCNPVLSIKPSQFDPIKALGWKILVAAYDGDPTFDRQIELVKVSEEDGIDVVANVAEGDYHGIDIYDELPKLKVLSEVVKKFVNSL